MKNRKPSSAMLGILLVVAVLGITAFEGTKNLTMFINLTGLILVIGGTTATAVLTFSLGETKRVIAGYLRALTKPKTAITEDINEVLALAQGTRSDPDYLKKIQAQIKNPFCANAVQLVVDGLPIEEVKNILRHMVMESYEREMADSQMFRVISKYPPAFGMMGTLIGLISMLQGMAGQNILQDLGPNMSVALVATFYGILVQNLLLIPFAESIEKQALLLQKHREIVASGVLMIQEQVPVILMRERLKSYLSEDERALVTTKASVSSIGRSATEANRMSGGRA